MFSSHWRADGVSA
ncbi:hypothetical protein YPPY36_1488, partial [Yersinia pestis PY-36]